MRPVSKAIWFIESNLKEPLDLASITEVAGVSGAHLCRVFLLVTGYSLFGYVRGRRLSLAASVLRECDVSVLEIALEHGYESREAFSRAFKKQFGISPQSLRTSPDQTIYTMEAISMHQKESRSFDPPRIETIDGFTVQGFELEHVRGADPAIPQLWGGVALAMKGADLDRNPESYGVCHSFDEEGMHYLAGFAASVSTDAIFAGERKLKTVRIPGGRYAVFSSSAHVSDIGNLWAHIHSDWHPGSGQVIADTPAFERYGWQFNAQTGTGGFEVWIPLSDKN